MPSTRSFVEYYGCHKVTSCGYCQTKKGRYDYGMWLHHLSTFDYQNLIDRGWRRSGCYGYKPMIDDACCPMYTIRCDTDNLKLSKCQKKVIKKFNRFILYGDKKKNYDMERHVSSESMYSSTESNLKSKNIFNEPSKYTIEKTKITDNSEIMKKCISKTPKLVEITDEDEDVKCKKILKTNPQKKKIQRFEKARLKLINKGKSEDEATEILKLKRKMPKIKSLEKFLSECEKPNATHKLDIKIVQSSPENTTFEHMFEIEYEIYRKYQTVVHKDDPNSCTKQQFRRFLVNSPLTPQSIDAENLPVQMFGSYHYQYWLNGVLIAVGVIDILPYCVSSVYFFYDPDYRFLALGTYGSMKELELVKKLHAKIPSLQYYYMGYYIHSCQKMRYKGRIRPSYLLCPETFVWCPIEQCFEKFYSLNYRRLNEDVTAEDEDKVFDLNFIPILCGHQILLCSEYFRKYNADESDEIREYAQAVGKKCAYSMILCRR